MIGKPFFLLAHSIRIERINQVSLHLFREIISEEKKTNLEINHDLTTARCKSCLKIKDRNI
jgi:hypothetical protein